MLFIYHRFNQTGMAGISARDPSRSPNHNQRSRLRHHHPNLHPDHTASATLQQPVHAAGELQHNWRQQREHADAHQPRRPGGVQHRLAQAAAVGHGPERDGVPEPSVTSPRDAGGRVS